MRKHGLGVTYVTNATSEKIEAGTALARACEVCVLPNLYTRIYYVTCLSFIVHRVGLVDYRDGQLRRTSFQVNIRCNCMLRYDITTAIRYILHFTRSGRPIVISLLK